MILNILRPANAKNTKDFSSSALDAINKNSLEELKQFEGFTPREGQYETQEENTVKMVLTFIVCEL